MTVQLNIDRINELKTQIEQHCMCFNFEETEEYYFVLYPEGFMLGGARASKHVGKIKALELLLSSIEQHWKDEQL